jgi:hypothetical protein
VQLGESGWQHLLSPADQTPSQPGAGLAVGQCRAQPFGAMQSPKSPIDDDADGSGKAYSRTGGQDQQQYECFNRVDQVKPLFAFLRSRDRLEAG